MLLHKKYTYYDEQNKMMYPSICPFIFFLILLPTFWPIIIVMITTIMNVFLSEKIKGKKCVLDYKTEKGKNKKVACHKFNMFLYKVET